jgi:hypothetical protein
MWELTNVSSSVARAWPPTTISSVEVPAATQCDVASRTNPISMRPPASPFHRSWVARAPA